MSKSAGSARKQKEKKIMYFRWSLSHNFGIIHLDYLPVGPGAERFRSLVFHYVRTYVPHRCRRHCIVKFSFECDFLLFGSRKTTRKKSNFCLLVYAFSLSLSLAVRFALACYLCINARQRLFAAEWQTQSRKKPKTMHTCVRAARPKRTPNPCNSFLLSVLVARLTKREML